MSTDGFPGANKTLQVMAIDFCERTVLVQVENVKELVRIHLNCLYMAGETIPARN